MSTLTGAIPQAAAAGAHDPSAGSANISRTIATQASSGSTAALASTSADSKKSRSPSSGSEKAVDAQFEGQKNEHSRSGFKTGNGVNVSA